MELEKLGFGDVTMMDGERIVATLNLRDGPGDGTDAIMLTDKRLIHLVEKGRNREAALVSLQDVSAVEINSERRGGYSGFIWGALALVAALLVWRVWDNPALSFLAALGVALMGVYLVVDQLLSPNTLRAVFRAGSHQLELSVDNAHESGDVYAFANRLFELKGEGRREQAEQRIDFAPR